MSSRASGSSGALDNQRVAMRFGIRMAFVWMIVAGVAFVVQRQIAAQLLPLSGAIVGLLQEDFTVSLQLLEDGGCTLIQVTPFLIRPIPLTGDLALRPFVSLAPFTVNVDHALVPLVLLTTAIASWSFSGWREAAVRVALGLAALLPVLALTTPVLLVGMQQIAFVEAAQHHGGNVQQPALLTLMIFMECGGRWLLPLALALACVAGASRICPTPVRTPPSSASASVRGPTEMVFPPV